MRAKTILSVLFLISIGVAAFVIVHALPPQRVDASPEAAQTSEILVATGRSRPAPCCAPTT